MRQTQTFVAMLEPQTNFVPISPEDTTAEGALLPALQHNGHITKDQNAAPVSFSIQKRAFKIQV